MAWFNQKKNVDTNSNAYKSGGKIAEKVFFYEQKLGQFLNDFQHKIGFKTRNVLLLILAIIYLLFLFFQ